MASSMTGTGARIVNFSTDHVPERDRIAYWREHYGKVMLRVDLEPASDVAFEAEMPADMSALVDALRKDTRENA